MFRLLGPSARMLGEKIKLCSTFFLGIVGGCTQPSNLYLDVLEIGTQTQVLVDDFVLERTEALRRQVNPLFKHESNPLLKPLRSWEGHYTLPTTVLFDESDQLFKMWYLCLEEGGNSIGSKARWAYAFSSDGVVWDRPNLGLTSFRGSRRNNLLSYPVSCVLLDLREKDPNRRFKALGHYRVQEDAPLGLLIGFSPDGLNWKAYPKNPLLSETGGRGTHKGIGGIHTIFGWDEGWSKYVAFMRPSRSFSNIGLSLSSDFMDWRLPTPVLVPDWIDPPGTQFYGMSVFQDRGVYWGLLWVHHPNSLMMDVQLAFSRDLVGWRRVGSRHPILTYGVPAQFDSHMLRALKPLVVGDQIRVYYAAESEAHALTREDLSPLSNSMEATPEVLVKHHWPQRKRGFGGLAVCRRDGFVSLDSGSSQGVLLSKQFTCRGNQIILNADASQGRLQVEILDRSGQPLKGFSELDSDILMGDSIHHVASWQGSQDISSLKGKVIRVRFLMTNTKLYSFTCSDAGVLE